MDDERAHRLGRHLGWYGLAVLIACVVAFVASHAWGQDQSDRVASAREPISAAQPPAGFTRLDADHCNKGNVCFVLTTSADQGLDAVRAWLLDLGYRMAPRICLQSGTPEQACSEQGGRRDVKVGAIVLPGGVAGDPVRLDLSIFGATFSH